MLHGTACRTAVLCNSCINRPVMHRWVRHCPGYGLSIYCSSCLRLTAVTCLLLLRQFKPFKPVPTKLSVPLPFLYIREQNRGQSKKHGKTLKICQDLPLLISYLSVTGFNKSKDEDCFLRLEPPASEVIPFCNIYECYGCICRCIRCECSFVMWIPLRDKKGNVLDYAAL